jgi:tetratricopeptide (TPR) repeat protein
VTAFPARCGPGGAGLGLFLSAVAKGGRSVSKTVPARTAHESPHGRQRITEGMKDRLLSVFRKQPAWLLLVGLLVGALWLTARAMHGPSLETPAYATLAECPPAPAFQAVEPRVLQADEGGSLVVDEVSGPRLLPAAITQTPDETALPPCLTDGDLQARTAPAHQARRSGTLPESMASAPPAASQADLPTLPAVTERGSECGGSGAPARSEAARADQRQDPGGDSQKETIGRARGVVCVARPAYAWRSPDLELIAREADMHTRRGFALAGRGAYFSARAEFIAALRLLAQGLDAQYETRLHSRALAAGLTAVKEAGDFIPAGSRLEADLDLPSLVAAHRTPVLQDAPSESLTPLVALRSYFTFAQEQLAAAAGREIAGSMALHGLGNLHRALARQRGGLVQAAEPKAMVFYQAALLVCPDNYMASNELGVLLAQAGRHEAARITLEHSVSVCEQPAGWYNLAVVYRQLGQAEWAWQAYHRSRAIGGGEAAGGATSSPASGQQVRWADPGAFTLSDGGPPFAGSATARPPWSPGWKTTQTNPAAGRHVAQSPVSSRPDERR